MKEYFISGGSNADMPAWAAVIPVVFLVAFLIYMWKKR